jgi:hypothetical protein
MCSDVGISVPKHLSVCYLATSAPFVNAVELARADDELIDINDKPMILI